MVFTQPEVSLAGISVTDVSRTGQLMLVRLRVDNPNNYALPIDRVVYDLQVNGQPSARGESTQAVTILQRGSDIRGVPAVTDVAGILRQMAVRATAWPPNLAKAQPDGAAVSRQRL